jgi:hypothetical protein
MNLTLDVETHMKVVAMISTTAANFELWLEKRWGSVEDHRGNAE